ncbi:ferritin family protein [Desulfomarina sp.]
MFTLSDICNIAIQIEENGAETYRRASEGIEDPKLAEVLTWMALEEEKHARWFESIQSDQTLSSEQREMAAIGRSLLTDIIKSNTFSLDREKLEEAGSFKEILAQSIEFEQDTILFYEILLDFLDNDETREKLQMIIREEKNHIKKLETLADQSCAVEG